MTVIIDSHVHLWDLKRLRYPWLEEFAPLRETYTLQRLEQEVFSHGSGPELAGIVAVQADAIPEQSMDEVRLIESQMRGTVPVLAMVAYASVERGKAVSDELEALTASPLVRGVRRNAQNESDEFMARAAYRDGIVEVARAGLVVEVCIQASQLEFLRDAADELFSRAPEATLVIDHGAKPDVDSGSFAAWSAALRQVASMGRTVCKLSGLVTQGKIRERGMSVVEPYAREILDVFGAERTMFGSDWPVLRLQSDYLAWLRLVDAILAGWSIEEREQVFSDTAKSTYHIHE